VADPDDIDVRLAAFLEGALSRDVERRPDGRRDADSIDDDNVVWVEMAPPRQDIRTPANSQRAG